jgi:hypothetical protein
MTDLINLPLGKPTLIERQADIDAESIVGNEILVD